MQAVLQLGVALAIIICTKHVSWILEMLCFYQRRLSKISKFVKHSEKLWTVFAGYLISLVTLLEKKRYIIPYSLITP
jgi:hypothetical protein